MRLTHGDTAVVRRERMRGYFMRVVSYPMGVIGSTADLNTAGPSQSDPSSPHFLHRHAARRAAQKGGGEGVKVPAHISRQPAQHLEAGAAVLALDPRHRHLRDLPAEAMRLHE